MDTAYFDDFIDNIEYLTTQQRLQLIKALNCDDKIKLTKITKTSFACPAQWDAWDEEGNYYYFRFRHGYFRAEKNGDIIFESGEFDGDGCMSYDELKDNVGHIFEFPEYESNNSLNEDTY
ncbi:MAG: hypothetical protein KDC47_07370 [Flavobacteriaceae bacterium]|nr:hypothetical protein [Flavobacteriaceae bacterium]